jgi:hypothetical protein
MKPLHFSRARKSTCSVNRPELVPAGERKEFLSTTA